MRRMVNDMNIQRRTMLRAALVAVIPAAVTRVARGGDWPQLLGPKRNGIAEGEPIVEPWPVDGPPVLWKHKVGQGWAGPVVAQGKLLIFHRVGDNDLLERLDGTTGAVEWTMQYLSGYVDGFGFDEGPRATPTIDGDRVFTHGAQGLLHCVDFATGKQVWKLDTAGSMKSGQGFFGRACSPLVEGDLLIVQIGGEEGAGVVALKKATGQLAWKATGDEAGYSSPVAATLGGKRRIVCFTRNGLVLLDPADGKVVYSKRWRSSMSASVNAAMPLVVGDVVLVTSSYSTGALAVDFSGAEPRELWSGEKLASQYTTPVYHDGLVYGMDGRVDFPPGPSLRCLDFKTGEARWTTEPLGGASLTISGDKLLVLTEKGELILAKLGGEGFKALARAQVVGFDTRAHPALSEGLFYARDKRQLVCVDLRPRR